MQESLQGRLQAQAHTRTHMHRGATARMHTFSMTSPTAWIKADCALTKPLCCLCECPWGSCALERPCRSCAWPCILPIESGASSDLLWPWPWPWTWPWLRPWPQPEPLLPAMDGIVQCACPAPAHTETCLMRVHACLCEDEGGQTVMNRPLCIVNLG